VGTRGNRWAGQRGHGIGASVQKVEGNLSHIGTEINADNERTRMKRDVDVINHVKVMGLPIFLLLNLDTCPLELELYAIPSFPA
jgi:hypothetical protein